MRRREYGDEGGGGDVLSFLRKRKEPKENLFGEKLRFSGKVFCKGEVRNRVPAFTEPAPSWGAWKGLCGGSEFCASTFFSRMARGREGWHSSSLPLEGEGGPSKTGDEVDQKPQSKKFLSPGQSPPTRRANTPCHLPLLRGRLFLRASPTERAYKNRAVYYGQVVLFPSRKGEGG